MFVVVMDAGDIPYSIFFRPKYHWFCALDKSDLPPESDKNTFDKKSPGKYAILVWKWGWDFKVVSCTVLIRWSELLDSFESS